MIWYRHHARFGQNNGQVRLQAYSKAERLKTWPVKMKAISDPRVGHICKATAGSLRTSLLVNEKDSNFRSKKQDPYGRDANHSSDPQTRERIKYHLRSRDQNENFEN